MTFHKRSHDRMYDIWFYTFLSNNAYMQFYRKVYKVVQKGDSN